MSDNKHCIDGQEQKELDKIMITDDWKSKGNLKIQVAFSNLVITELLFAIRFDIEKFWQKFEEIGVFSG